MNHIPILETVKALNKMDTREVAEKLVRLCREDRNEQAIDELYAENIISKEPKGSNMEFTEGKEAVKQKTIRWEESLQELFSISISDPLVADDHFAVLMDIDATYKGHGRNKMSEICVYEVKNGKIIAEEFFYRMSS